MTRPTVIVPVAVPPNVASWLLSVTTSFFPRGRSLDLAQERDLQHARAVLHRGGALGHDLPARGRNRRDDLLPRRTRVADRDAAAAERLERPSRQPDAAGQRRARQVDADDAGRRKLQIVGRRGVRLFVLEQDAGAGPRAAGEVVAEPRDEPQASADPADEEALRPGEAAGMRPSPG